MMSAARTATLTANTRVRRMAESCMRLRLGHQAEVMAWPGRQARERLSPRTARSQSGRRCPMYRADLHRKARSGSGLPDPSGNGERERANSWPVALATARCTANIVRRGGSGEELPDVSGNRRRPCRRTDELPSRKQPGLREAVPPSECFFPTASSGPVDQYAATSDAHVGRLGGAPVRDSQDRADHRGH